MFPEDWVVPLESPPPQPQHASPACNPLTGSRNSSNVSSAFHAHPTPPPPAIPALLLHHIFCLYAAHESASMSVHSCVAGSSLPTLLILMSTHFGASSLLVMPRHIALNLSHLHDVRRQQSFLEYAQHPLSSSAMHMRLSAHLIKSRTIESNAETTMHVQVSATVVSAKKQSVKHDGCNGQ